VLCDLQRFCCQILRFFLLGLSLVVSDINPTHVRLCHCHRLGVEEKEGSGMLGLVGCINLGMWRVQFLLGMPAGSCLPMHL